jgi:rhamnulokinase
MAEKRVLAFDYGASSGRAIIGSFDGKSISLKEIHRFSNDPVIVNGTMYWDTLSPVLRTEAGTGQGKTGRRF